MTDIQNAARQMAAIVQEEWDREGISVEERERRLNAFEKSFDDVDKSG